MSYVLLRLTVRRAVVSQRYFDLGGEFRPGLRLPGDHENGVIPGDRSDNVRQRSAIECTRQIVRCPRRRAQHRDVAARIVETSNSPSNLDSRSVPPETPRTGLPSSGRRRRRAAVCGAKLTAPNSSRSRDKVAWVASMPSAASSAASRSGCVPACATAARRYGLAAGTGRGARRLRLRPACEKPDQQRFCGAAGSRPRPTPRLRSVDDVGGDLFAAMCGQAVQDNGVGSATASSSALIWNFRNGPTRSSPSFSCPMDVQVSVTSGAAPFDRRLWITGER